MENLEKLIRVLDEAMFHCEENGIDYTRFYRSLIRKRRALVRANKVFEREDRRLRKHGDL